MAVKIVREAGAAVPSALEHARALARAVAVDPACLSLAIRQYNARQVQRFRTSIYGTIHTFVMLPVEIRSWLPGRKYNP